MIHTIIYHNNGKKANLFITSIRNPIQPIQYFNENLETLFYILNLTLETMQYFTPGCCDSNRSDSVTAITHLEEFPQ